MDFHHIVTDGVSIEILMEEMSKLYSGMKLERTGIQYKDYAVWQNGLMRDGSMEEAEKYWVERFSGELPVLNLPVDYTRPKVQSYEGSKVSFRIDSEMKKKLEALGKKHNATLFMTLLTGFKVLLSKYSGQEDIVTGIPAANRQRPEVEKVVGMFVNTLALRTRIDPEKSFAEQLLEVRKETLKAYGSQEYPFEQLVEKLRLKKDAGRNPLFDVMLAMQDIDTGKIKAGRTKAEGIPAGFWSIQI